MLSRARCARHGRLCCLNKHTLFSRFSTFRCEAADPRGYDSVTRPHKLPIHTLGPAAEPWGCSLEPQPPAAPDVPN